MGQAPAGMCAAVSSSARALAQAAVAHPSFGGVVGLTFVLILTSSSSSPAVRATRLQQRGCEAWHF